MKNIYVLYGTNKFLIDYNLKKIVNGEETEDYDLEEMTIQDVLGYARELPMFSEYKYVVCDNSSFLSSSKCKLEHNLDDLINYINKPVNSTILIFIVRSEKLDSRKKVNALLDKTAKVIECIQMSENDIFKYTLSLFENNKMSVADNIVKYLINRVNSDVNVLKNEVSKLCLLDCELTKEVIDDLVHESIDDNIFVFIDSIINNDKKKMFSIYEEEVKNGLEPIQIIAMLGLEFRTIYQVRVLTKKGYLEKDIMGILGIYKIGRIKFAKSKAKNLSNDRILKEINELANLDIKIKMGDIDKYIAFEQYLLKL